MTNTCINGNIYCVGCGDCLVLSEESLKTVWNTEEEDIAWVDL